MNTRWLNIRESAVSLLRIFAVLVALFLLSSWGIQVFIQVDNGITTWYNIIGLILNGLTEAAYYGGIVFALSWIVSLIGRQNEENSRSGWLDNRESAVSLLKILALSVVLFYLLMIGIGTFALVDQGYYDDNIWTYIIYNILWPVTKAAYQGGTVFALAWIVSLIGSRNEENVRSGWLNNRESAVSLLRIFALSILLLSLPLAVFQKFLWTDLGWDRGWEYTVPNMLNILYTVAYQGGTIFALSWIMSMIGRGDNDEVPDEAIN